jgi:hypothetical protein
MSALASRALRAIRQLTLVSVSLLLVACGAVTDASPTARSTALEASPSTGPRAAAPHSPVPTESTTDGEVYVNETRGWSIVVPRGWEVQANQMGDTALVRDQVIAEVLVFPASGLPIESLEAEKLDEVMALFDPVEAEAEIIRLPAGEAVNVSARTNYANSAPGFFVVYVIEKDEWQYVISVRGPETDTNLLHDAEALAKSFALLD